MDIGRFDSCQKIMSTLQGLLKLRSYHILKLPVRESYFWSTFLILQYSSHVLMLFVVIMFLLFLCSVYLCFSVFKLELIRFLCFIYFLNHFELQIH